MRGAVVEDVLTRDQRQIESETIVIQVANQVVDSLSHELRGFLRMHVIGDAMAPRGIGQAIFDANRVVRQLDQ